MVFARTRLLIEEDVLKPENKQSYKFEIKDPKKLYEQFYEIVREVFAVREAALQEKSIEISDSGKIKSEFELVKDLDDISYVYIIMKFKGSPGSVKISVEPYVRTEYPQDTVWQKSLLYEVGRMFADKVFYERKRLQYIADVQRRLKKFRQRLQKAVEEI